jgi:membrane protein implicated in regulation of membrane protease activity
MSLGNVMLGAVILATIAYAAILIFGMISIWPFGIVGLAVLLFMGLMLGIVVVQRARDPEDRHYSRNVKE